MKMTLFPLRIALRHAIRTAIGHSADRHTVVVELSDGDVAGYGEVVCIRRQGFTATRVTELLERVRPLVERYAGEHPAEFWQQCAVELAPFPSVLAAVDVAVHDVFAKRLGVPLWKLWGLDPAAAPVSSYTLGIDTREALLGRLDEVAGWHSVKLKIDDASTVADVAGVATAWGGRVRLDANGSLGLERAFEFVDAAEDLAVEMLEQPFAPGDAEAQGTLRSRTNLLLVADESCRGVADVAACASDFDVVNVKVAKCGGLTPALALIKVAKRAQLLVMIGCHGETTVGTSATAQLLPLADFADVDSSNLIADDVAEGVDIRKGSCILSEHPGTGVRPEWQRLRQQLLARDDE